MYEICKHVISVLHHFITLINISRNLPVVGKSHYEKNSHITNFFTCTLPQPQRKGGFLLLKIKQAKIPAEALAIYSSSDNNFLRTCKEQNHLKINASHLLFPLLN